MFNSTKKVRVQRGTLSFLDFQEFFNLSRFHFSLPTAIPTIPTLPTKPTLPTIPTKLMKPTIFFSIIVSLPSTTFIDFFLSRLFDTEAKDFVLIHYLFFTVEKMN